MVISSPISLTITSTFKPLPPSGSYSHLMVVGEYGTDQIGWNVNPPTADVEGDDSLTPSGFLFNDGFHEVRTLTSPFADRTTLQIVLSNSTNEGWESVDIGAYTFTRSLASGYNLQSGYSRWVFSSTPDVFGNNGDILEVTWHLT